MIRGPFDDCSSEATATAAVLTGSSIATRTLVHTLAALAPLRTHVLFIGEPGTGRRTCAERLHADSPQRDRPFFAVSLATATDAQIATRLFGPRGCAGLRAQARGATIYMDGIERLPLDLQSRLCEALADGETPGVRVLAATTRSLETAVGSGMFSRPLFDRIGLIQLFVPPLRERAADIAPIALHALATWNRRPGVRPRRFGSDALTVLENHRWPGNVRELVDLVHGACDRTRSRTVTAARFRLMLGRRPRRASASDVIPLRQLECDYILHVLARCHGNQSLAAQRLGIGRGTLARRLLDCERGTDRVVS